MSSADERLAGVLPQAPGPLGPQVLIDAVAMDDGVAYVSGQVAFDGGSGPVLGKVGADVSVELAAEEAARAVANGLYRLIEMYGSLDVVERVLKLTVFVNATDSLVEQPAVADGASRALIEILGDRGRHARSAVGMASLPLGAAVEVEMIVKVTV